MRRVWLQSARCSLAQKFCVRSPAKLTRLARLEGFYALHAMKKSLPPRPAKEFTVCSIAWHLDIVQRHTKAGFEDVPDEIVYRRFFQFLDFIQRHGFTVHTVAASLADVTRATALRNSDLTDEGFRFIQYAENRWCSRLYKDTGAEKEWAFLERWLRSYLAARPLLVSVAKDERRTRGGG